MRLYVYNKNFINSLNDEYIGKYTYLDGTYDYTDININLTRLDIMDNKFNKYWL